MMRKRQSGPMARLGRITTETMRRRWTEMAAKASATADRSGPAPHWMDYVPPGVRGMVQPRMPEGVMDLLGKAGVLDRMPGFRPAAPDVPPQRAHGGRFLSRSFSNAAGTRPFKLFVPSGYVAGRDVPLIVMLHGCTQSADDLAAGTRMNEAAEARTWLVAYPEQTRSAQPQKCWNWFSAGHQQRDQGEPSLIAGITRQVMAEYGVDPRRVFVAGMSAGGAAAAIMGETYPELYAAVGVHSGLACGTAHDLSSAMAAMKNGASGVPARLLTGRLVPTIVFHGDRDTVVSPRNGADVIARATGGTMPKVAVRSGQVPNGRAYRQTIHSDAAGRTVVEDWTVHQQGHAWSGGSPAGSYTDPEGPDATAEMLRFFEEHPFGS